MRLALGLTFVVGAAVVFACGSEDSGGGVTPAGDGGASSSSSSSSSGASSTSSSSSSSSSGGTGDPAVCGAPLGAACDAGKACDLGLACEAGTCACTNPPCSVACWTDRVVDHLALGGDVLLVSQRGASAPEWEVDRIEVAGGGPKLVTSGAGAAKIAVQGESLYVAAGPATSNNTVARMKLDGSQAAVVVPTLSPPIRWLTATPSNILVSLNRSIFLYDANGALVRFVVNAPSQNVPRWVTVDGNDVYWVSDNVDQPKDQIYKGNLDGSEPLQIGGNSGDIPVFVACQDALYWSTSDQVQRAQRGEQAGTPIARSKNGIACGAGGTTFLTGFGEFSASGQESLAVRMRSADGTTKVLYEAAQGPSITQVPGEIVASPAFLYWVQTADKIQRIMRLPRP